MARTKATKEPGIQLIQGSRGSYYRVQIRVKGCPHLPGISRLFLKQGIGKPKPSMLSNLDFLLKQ